MGGAHKDLYLQLLGTPRKKQKNLQGYFRHLNIRIVVDRITREVTLQGYRCYTTKKDVIGLAKMKTNIFNSD